MLGIVVLGMAGLGFGEFEYGEGVSRVLMVSGSVAVGVRQHG